MGEDIDDNGDDDDEDDDEENNALLLPPLPRGTGDCGEVPGEGGILGNGSGKQGRGEMGVSGIPLPSTAPLLSRLSRLNRLAGTSGTRSGGVSEAHTSWVALEGHEHPPPSPQQPRPIFLSQASSSLQGVGTPQSPAPPSSRPPSWLQHLQQRHRASVISLCEYSMGCEHSALRSNLMKRY